MIESILLILFFLLISHLISKKLNLNPLILFIGLWIALWPFSLNLFNKEVLESLSEIWIIFLMFYIGLHINIKELKKMKKYVIWLGLLQIGLTALLFLAFFDIIYYFNAEGTLSFFKFFLLGGALALSSSAIVLEKIIEFNLTNTSIGKAKIGVLIFQDLIAPLFLIFIPILAKDLTKWQDLNMSLLGYSLLKTIGLLILVYITIVFILKPFFERILEFLYDSEKKAFKSLAWLLIVLSPAVFAEHLGISAWIWALILGLSITETKFKKQALMNTDSWKEIFLRIFFVYIGTLLDLKLLIDNLNIILIITIWVKAVKILGTYLSCKLLRISNKDSLLIGLNLSQVSEFSFIILATLLSSNFINDSEFNFFTIIIVLSMILSIIITNISFKLIKK